MISVISVCRNEEKLIDDTISSVFRQDYKDYEYIIKDAGSTDTTMAKIRAWEPRFRDKGISFTVLSGADKGIYDGMNLAVQSARGDYINFMNAGDCFASDDVLSRIFGSSGKIADKADLIYGDAVEEEYGELHYFRKCPGLIQSRMPFSHQSVFVKRELLLKYPFRLKYGIAADYDFLLTLYDKAYVFEDSGVLVAKVSKDGKSSLRLKDTYLESLKLRREHGISVPEGGELKRKLAWLSVKQFGMDNFPDGLKYMIRKMQRKLRGQKRFVENEAH